MYIVPVGTTVHHQQSFARVEGVLDVLIIEEGILELPDTTFQSLMDDGTLRLVEPGASALEFTMLPQLAHEMIKCELRWTGFAEQLDLFQRIELVNHQDVPFANDGEQNITVAAALDALENNGETATQESYLQILAGLRQYMFLLSIQARITEFGFVVIHDHSQEREFTSVAFTRGLTDRKGYEFLLGGKDLTSETLTMLVSEFSNAALGGTNPEMARLDLLEDNGQRVKVYSQKVRADLSATDICKLLHLAPGTEKFFGETKRYYQILIDAKTPDGKPVTIDLNAQAEPENDDN